MTDRELYDKAKEAYYNGAPIMEDFEFDELERKLGLENESYVGSRHNPTYTIPHPFIMGSLSKIQIKKDKNGDVNWSDYFDAVRKYVGDNECIITPKYDGCSFEVILNSDGEIVSISSRGDGMYGKDLLKHIINKVNLSSYRIMQQILAHTDFDVIRVRLTGEVLIDKNIFNKKYSEYVNPRSFVSGILNRDYDSTDTELLDMLDDLSVVIYDIRYEDKNGWKDTDWSEFEYPHRPMMSHTGLHLVTSAMLESIYNQYEEYRNDDCPWALDGIVIKPTAPSRINNTTDVRPKDCVAVKFIPQLSSTTVREVIWEQGKTGELYPVVITDPVVMDGKTITRVSGHNWGWMVSHGVGVGAKITMSLAGDIIPFIYKVDHKSEMVMRPENTHTEGCHLYPEMDENDRHHLSFISSAQALGIPGIGPMMAETLWLGINRENDEVDDFLGVGQSDIPDNILMVKPHEIESIIGGKNGKNARKSFETLISSITVKDIVKSCAFRFCGDRMSAQVERELLYGDGDWTSMAREGYEWCLDNSSPEYHKVMTIMAGLFRTLDDFKTKPETTEAATPSDAIPVILTGEPNDYATKGEFLKCHPEYRVTGSWKEVKIVFTNSMDSTTGKMKKAKEKNIEIRLY